VRHDVLAPSCYLDDALTSAANPLKGGTDTMAKKAAKGGKKKGGKKR
jgi:hypothetical protein